MKKNKTNQQTIIGIDLGDKKHAICVTDKDGNILNEFSIANRHTALEKLADDFPDSLIAMEVGGPSPWVSRLLTKKGAEVIVANARKLRAIYQNERKCDRYDAQMLAKLVRVDPTLLYPVHHGSEQAQKDLLAIKFRDNLVRQRVNTRACVRGSLKSLGIRLPSCSSSSYARNARRELSDNPEILSSIEPSLANIEELNAKIREYEKSIDNAGKQSHPQAQLLQQIPGVGPITSLCFVLTIEDPERFRNPRDIGAYLGLVPRRDQSGDSDKQLPISKTGNRYLRCLLVQCAHYILGHFGPDCDLRRQGLKLAARGGKAAKKKATIAIARKLAVLLLVLWRQQSEYKPLLNAGDQIDLTN